MAPRPSGLLVVLAVLGFISLGLPDAALGVAWPSIRQSFDLPVDRLGWLLGMMMVGYLVSSACSGAIVARLGVGRLLAASGVMVGLAAAGYAVSPAWWLVVALGLPLGLGAGAIDAGINAYAATSFPPRWVTWLHASYGAGAMAGPLLLTAVMSAKFGWRSGYALLGVTLLGLSTGFALTANRWGPRPVAAARPALPVSARRSGILPALRQQIVLLHVAIFMVYTGLEVAVGQWTFSLLAESRGWTMASAGAMTSFYWTSLTAGRVLFGFLRDGFDPNRVLRVVMVGVVVSAAALRLLPGAIATAAAITALGFLFAPVFPLMISLTPRRVGGSLATHVIGWQVSAAYVGAAILPAFVGWLAARWSLEVLGLFTALAATLLLMLHEAACAVASAPAAAPAATSP
jgi:fucose permease